LMPIEVLTAREARMRPCDQSVRGSLASKTFRVATKQPCRVSPDSRTPEARVLYRLPEAEASNGSMFPGRSSGSRLERNTDTFPFSIHHKKIETQWTVSFLTDYSSGPASDSHRLPFSPPSQWRHLSRRSIELLPQHCHTSHQKHGKNKL
jgi:hypothetical protein